MSGCFEQSVAGQVSLNLREMLPRRPQILTISAAITSGGLCANGGGTVTVDAEPSGPPTRGQFASALLLKVDVYSDRHAHRNHCLFNDRGLRLPLANRGNNGVVDGRKRGFHVQRTNGPDLRDLSVLID